MPDESEFSACFKHMPDDMMTIFSVKRVCCQALVDFFQIFLDIYICAV